MTSRQLPIPVERIEKSIFLVRGLKVILDRDLAELYGVRTKALKQAVRRNAKRFLDDPAEVHHRHLVREVGHHPDVVGYE